MGWEWGAGWKTQNGSDVEYIFWDKILSFLTNPLMDDIYAYTSY